MSKRNGGGAAFPRPTSTDESLRPCNVEYGQTGMSLCDYFAAKAMQELLASTGDFDPEDDAWKVALASYQVADAMMSEREEE